MPFDGTNVKSLCIPEVARPERWRNAVVKNGQWYTGWRMFPSPEAARAALEAHGWQIPCWVIAREGRVLWESWDEATQIRVE